MSHIASDLAVELAFEIADLPEEEAFSDKIASNRARLADLSLPIETAETEQASAESFMATLPKCSDDETLAFSAPNRALQDLVALLESAETIADLLVAAEAHVAWRQELEANLPGCIEAMINAGLAYRVSSNHIAALALDYAGVMPEPNAEFPVKTHLLGIVTLKVIADEMSAAIEASGRQADELIEAAPDGGLPDCG